MKGGFSMKNKKILLIILVLLFSIALVTLPEGVYSKTFDKPKHNKSIVIYRDNFGVPHIYAKDTFGLFYGYGYSIATDRLFQMEMARRTVLGRVAEVLGPSFIDFDKSVRSNYSPESIQKQYQALDKKYKDIFEGYAAGMNARILEVLENKETLLPKQFIDYDFLPNPDWTAFDIVMIFVGTMCNRYSDFTIGLSNLDLLNYLNSIHSPEDAWKIFNQLQWINDPGAPSTISSEDIKNVHKKVSRNKEIAKIDYRYFKNNFQYTVSIEEKKSRQEKELLSIFGLDFLVEPPLASNVWILGKKKTYDRGAIFINGPQFGWYVPGYVYEIGLHGAGFDAVGNAPFGYPFVQFGHNKHIAWGSTAGGGALVDIYEELLNPSNKYQYWYNGEWRDMEKRTDIIYVRGGAPVSVDIYRTVHGFIVRFDFQNNLAYSKKRSWEGYELETLIGWIESTKAENYYQWREAAKKSAITINWFYADRRGNIGYIHTGKYPIRKENHDFRLPASGTGDMEWLGILPFDQNPQVYNPKQGYITNWNNKPADYWNGTSWGSADRVQVIIDELESKGKFTKEEAWEINKRISFIDLNISYFLPFIEQAVEGLSSSDPRKQAVELMKSWDRYRKDQNNDGKYDDPAQTIFQKWLAVMLEKTLKDDLGASFARFSSTGYSENPASPPSGSTNVQQGTRVLYHALLGEKSTIPNEYDFFNNIDPNLVILDALDKTILDLTNKYGTNDMSQWLLPVVPQKFFHTNFAGVPQANPAEVLFLPIHMNRGTENHLVVLKPGGVEGWDVCPPGQSGFVGPDGTKGDHYLDQMDLYGNFQLKPMLFDFNDVVKNSGPPQMLIY